MKPDDGKTVEKLFNQENLPAPTLIGFVLLAISDFLLEVEAIAVIGCGTGILVYIDSEPALPFNLVSCQV
jgi:hypothetical protein